jgi:C-terminal processing protease CtpA/Prc
MNIGDQLRMMLKGEKDNGDEFTMTVMLQVGEGATGAEKLAAIGLETRQEEGKTLIDNVVFASPAEKANIDWDQEILNLQVPAKRPPKQLMFLPAFLVFGLVYMIQRRRSKLLAYQ